MFGQPGVAAVSCRSSQATRREVEGDPMIYIVTMLLVFSAGIASLMVIYMKKEQVEKCNKNIKKKLCRGSGKTRTCTKIMWMPRGEGSGEGLKSHMMRIGVLC